MPNVGFSDALLEAFLFVLIFVISCWVISKPKKTITTEPTPLEDTTEDSQPLEKLVIEDSSNNLSPAPAEEPEKLEDQDSETLDSEKKELILNPVPNGEALRDGVAYAVGGAAVAATFGGIGLAVGGTAIAVGMAPVVAVGAVLGLAGYGFWKLVSK